MKLVISKNNNNDWNMEYKKRLNLNKDTFLREIKTY